MNTTIISYVDKINYGTFVHYIGKLADGNNFIVECTESSINLYFRKNNTDFTHKYLIKSIRNKMSNLDDITWDNICNFFNLICNDDTKINIINNNYEHNIIYNIINDDMYNDDDYNYDYNNAHITKYNKKYNDIVDFDND